MLSPFAGSSSLLILRGGSRSLGAPISRATVGAYLWGQLRAHQHRPVFMALPPLTTAPCRTESFLRAVSPHRRACVPWPQQLPPASARGPPQPFALPLFEVFFSRLQYFMPQFEPHCVIN